VVHLQNVTVKDLEIHVEAADIVKMIAHVTNHLVHLRVIAEQPPAQLIIAPDPHIMIIPQHARKHVLVERAMLARAVQHHIITMRDAAHAAILQEDALDAIGHTLPIARRLDADRHTLFMIPHAVQAVYVQRHL